MQILKGIRLAAFCLMVINAGNLSAGKTIAIKWKERNDKIVHSSVCYNYAKGSLKYRQCRSRAKQHFAERCRHFTETYKTTRSLQRAKHKKRKRKFCYSARNFSIVD